jgi:hypothetical protein
MLSDEQTKLRDLLGKQLHSLDAVAEDDGLIDLESI